MLLKYKSLNQLFSSSFFKCSKNLPIGVNALKMKAMQVEINHSNNVLKGSFLADVKAKIKPIKIGMDIKAPIDA